MKDIGLRTLVFMTSSRGSEENELVPSVFAQPAVNERSSVGRIE